jgi:hypothetical protein
MPAKRKGNTENIREHQWKKGQSGNPKGRPKLPDIKEAIAKTLTEKKTGKDGKKVSAIDTVLKALLIKAIQGDVRAAEVLLDRAYGKPNQALQVTNVNIDVARPPDDDGDEMPGDEIDG